MNAHLQKILDLVSKSTRVTEGDKAALAKEIKEAEKAIEQQRKTLGSQQRELEIEAALERVRSRTMAMHQSGEFKEVVSVLYGQLDALGMADWGCSIMIFDEKADQIENWVAESTGSDLKCFVVEGQGHPVYKKLWQHWKKQGSPLRLHHTVEKKWEFDRYWLNETGFSSLPEKVKRSVLEEREIFLTYICMHHGLINVSGYSRLPDEKLAILQRFAKVFEQTYTRFLDLQKAEAQAREAEIQLAMERVRARTLAMHQSDEFPEAANNLFLQVQALGIPAWSAGYCLWENDKTGYSCIMSSEGVLQKPMSLPSIGVGYDFKTPYSEGKKFHVEELRGEEVTAHYDFLLSLPDFRDNVEQITKAGFSLPTFQVFHCVYFSHGFLLFITYEPVPEQWDVFKRFGRVFQQTFNRFLDLQKAEAQAREAQIEAALERIRAKTMAMHQSDELKAVVKVIFDQLAHLGINAEHAGIVVDYEPEKDWHFWIADTQDIPAKVTVPYLDLVWDRQFTEAKKKGRHFFTTQLDFEEKNSFYKVLLPHIEGLTKKARDFYFSCPGLAASTVIQEDIGLYIENFSGTPYSGEENDILMRFGTVFQQTYTRFLDLQKAEAHAREAQIQLGLERVRARAMAMHTSAELSEVSVILYKELRSLGMTQFFNCGYVEVDVPNKIQHGWTSTFEGGETEGYTLPLTGEEVLDERYKQWKKQVPVFRQPVGGAKLLKHLEFVLPQLGSQKVREMTENNFSDPTIFYCCNFKHGYLSLITSEQLVLEEEALLARFTRAFELTYSRFLDLQKAEAQIREAQIEAALERVRAKTMAMHNSEDVGDTVISLFDEVIKLGLDKSIRCGIGILEGYEGMETWSVTSSPDGEVDLKMGMLDMTVHPLLKGVKNAWKKKEHGYSHALIGEQVTEYYAALNNEPEYPFNVDLKTLPQQVFHNSFSFAEGILFAFTYNPMTPEAGEILAKFASVFGQTYRRYLDLTKAERQAREAQIEAALERVRSRTMAMQHSSELNLILAKVFEELTSLELEMERAVIWTYNPEDRSVRWWAANPEAESGSESFYIGNCDDPVYNEYWKAWEERRSKYLYILEGEYKENWTDILFNKTELGRLPDIVKAAMVKPEKIYLYNTFNDFGVLFIACLEPLPADKFTILERFGKVFDQSYTRFNDIKQAEARAQEAIKQSSLDRVRGQIASMRSTTDLERITPLIWDELTTLGVPFIRCGVFIIDEAAQIVKAYLSSPKGKSLGVLNLPFNASTLTSDSVAYWIKKKVLHQHWNQEQFVAWTASLIERGLLKNRASYQGTSEPPESLDLHFIPFDQGMLYVGSVAALSSFQIELVQALANSFSVAYARYEDFAQLEKAKRSVEKTLSELKTTQNQLVQSEKMASLGELTAGIAHEIQNPLNFVNNFSEVSKELLEEMMEEMEKGDAEEVKAIAQDVIQNLEKINHHGKRADAIVKGMLQHSRSSSGQKEPTDVNALCDEYLRLAYHGLRAKDKSFNATMNTDFDPMVGNLNVVPQDMGRVILNLITNAFYACTERSRATGNDKKKAGIEHYGPTVWVSTKKHKDQVTIAVRDNGNGIPDAIKEKIFQPFFTTKPTGEGTGLGLSMSYDIVTKGHGGTLEVKTKQGKGSEFSITVPINQ